MRQIDGAEGAQHASTLLRRIYATRLTFFAAGVAIAAWAPLVPYVKQALGIEADVLGLLLLCLGLGSITAMPMTSLFVGRFGCRPVLSLSALLTIAVFPTLALATSPLQTGVALFIFGAAIGTLDVAMNIQASAVERAAGRPLMSAFHGFFSLGGMVGAPAMSLLLASDLSALAASGLAAGFLALILLVARGGWIGHLEKDSGHAAQLAIPRGAVIAVSLLCLVVGIVEGSVIDWGAVYLAEARQTAPSQIGFGFGAFAAAMTAARFLGDTLTARISPWIMLCLGGVTMAVGFGLIVFGPNLIVALVGFALIGLGAANMFPIFCSAAGKQKIMPAAEAIAAVVTFGYLGMMLGPALIGSLAHHHGLDTAFIALGAGGLLIALAARTVLPKDKD